MKPSSRSPLALFVALLFGFAVSSTATGCAASDEPFTEPVSAADSAQTVGVAAADLDGTYVNTQPFEPYRGSTNLRSLVIRRTEAGAFEATLGFRYVHPYFMPYFELTTTARVEGGVLVLEGDLQDMLDTASGRNSSVVAAHVEVSPLGAYAIARQGDGTTLTMTRYRGAPPVVLERR